MAGFKRTLNVTYGFVQAMCDLSSTKAPEGDTALTQLCTCEGAHDPAKPIWDPICPVKRHNGEADPSVKRNTLVKGSEVSKGNFVVFTAEEIAALKASDDEYKGVLGLVACDAAEFEAQSMPSGTSYYLAPNPKDTFFALLQQMISDSPDLAFIGRYTVTSRASTYRVRPYGNLLVAEQYLSPEEMLAAPSVEPKAVPEQMVEMAREVATKFVVPFNPADFADRYKAGLAAAIGVREASPTADITDAAPGTPVADPMAAMLAQMAAMVSAPAGNGTDDAPVAEKKPARKRTAKTKVA